MALVLMATLVVMALVLMALVLMVTVVAITTVVVNRFGSNGVGNDTSNLGPVMAFSGFWFALFAFELSVQLCPLFLCLCTF